MRIFVTGGTGLLGNTILRQLSGHHQLLSLVRGEPATEVFDGIDTDFVSGDLSDGNVIDAAVAECDAVIHSAGLIHIGWQRMAESMQVNCDGTRVVARACLEHQRKLVHVGTVNALAIGTKQGPSNEETPQDHAGGQIPCSYVVSKRAGVQEVLDLVKQGLRAVIVHPGFMLGPWDWKPSSGRMMLEVGRGWKPIAPSGGCCVCDSRDVAAGTIAALEAEVENGREFILGGENWKYVDLWAEMAKRMGTRPPLMPAGPAQRWIGAIAGDLWTKIAGEGDLNSAGVKMSSIYHWHDSSRAIAELGYQHRDAQESLDDCAKWIKKHHL
ncbi:MAG: NAD-dependent epimerase/dehydratase family protein [Rubripirellula sp.]